MFCDVMWVQVLGLFWLDLFHEHCVLGEAYRRWAALAAVEIVPMLNEILITVTVTM